MRHINEAELVQTVPAKLTRKEKLLHWAELIRAHAKPLYLYHMLEHYSPYQLARMYVLPDGNTAFALALADPAFQAAGLGSTTKKPSISTIMKFFEISKEELHEFSCDCGGRIPNETMANHIIALANK